MAKSTLGSCVFYVAFENIITTLKIPMTPRTVYAKYPEDISENPVSYC